LPGQIHQCDIKPCGTGADQPLTHQHFSREIIYRWRIGITRADDAADTTMQPRHIEASTRRRRFKGRGNVLIGAKPDGDAIGAGGARRRGGVNSLKPVSAS